MILRRSGGRLRWLPADLLAWPLALVGLALLTGLDWVTNRVADGPWTVRLLVVHPLHWLTRPLGWVGVLALALGVLAAWLANRLAVPGRWGTAMRYWPYRLATLVLLAGVLLSSWRLYGHVSDVADGGAQWRFFAAPRTRLPNDITTVVLALAAAACFLLSFGRAGRPAYAKRERVPTTTRASVTRTTPMPVGVASQMRSRAAARTPDDGS